MPLARDVDLAQIAAVTPGLVGADLRNLVNEAALLAARRGQDAVHQRDFLDALEKIVLGPERQLVMSPEDRERIAYHEGGHAMLGLLVPGADPVNRVTIVPRGQALGVTYQRPEDDRYNYGEGYLRARIVGALGGRAAEEIVYGTRTTGAENDIEQATELARQMVTRWGMSDELDMVALAPRESPFLGDGARLRRREALQRRDRQSDRRRGTADHQGEPRGSPATPRGAPGGARRACPGSPRTRDAGRAERSWRSRASLARRASKTPGTRSREPSLTRTGKIDGNPDEWPKGDRQRHVSSRWQAENRPRYGRRAMVHIASNQSRMPEVYEVPEECTGLHAL